MEVGEKNLKKKDRNRIVLATTPDGKTIKLNAKSTRHKYTKGDIVFYICDYLFFILFTIACIFPFYYIFINTISNAKLVNSGSINFIPRGLNIQNYLQLRNVSDLGNSVMISVLRTVIGTALMVIASAFVGYLMTKKEMWMKKFFYRFLVITMYFNAGLIPWYLNMQMLGLTNSFAAYIIPGIVAPYNIILVKTYIESIPSELEESAFIDGASFMTVFLKIVWPLSKPILATIAIFGAVGNWNSFQDSLILMSDDSLYTLQHRLYIYLNSSSNIANLMNKPTAGNNAALDYANNGLLIKYTVSMVSIIPILLVYPFMQKYFEEGIMLGAVKG
ncbi:carbohydrate ABC transporter membrane protein 2, CUT1 family [Eubacterium ruminantium]|nr:carbohydrate ABC transporter membrane protein 2, CUT1 family [Eubacterium ruminantium]